MFKKIALTLAVSLIAGSQILAPACSATIPQKQISLGGITLRPRMHKADVVKIYGEPMKNITSGFGSIKYGDGVKIFFEEGVVNRVEVTEENDWKTPAGLAVGMNIDEAARLYGEPDVIKPNGNKILYVYCDKFPNVRTALGIVCDKHEMTIEKLAIQTSNMTDAFAENDGWFSRWVNQMLK